MVYSTFFFKTWVAICLIVFGSPGMGSNQEEESVPPAFVMVDVGEDPYDTPPASPQLPEGDESPSPSPQGFFSPVPEQRFAFPLSLPPLAMRQRNNILGVAGAGRSMFGKAPQDQKTRQVIRRNPHPLSHGSVPRNDGTL